MSKRHRRSTKRAFNLRLKKGTVYSIVQVFFFALAGLILVSFSRQGLVLVRLNDLLISAFSWTTFILPFLFLSFALLVSKIKNPLGQPNVVIGGLLFFVSILTLGRAGAIGRMAWGGASSLVTSIGAFIVLLGTTLVGLIILFNTSFEQVIELASGIIAQAKKYILGEKGFSRQPSRGPMKVSGGALPQAGARPPQEVPGQLEQKLVSNVPGEEKVWKYPSIELLSDVESGKANRGDIKGNAATIEKTLESFGIPARVVEVNLGPAVTQYALEVALGTKLSKITSLERDLALALAAPTGTIRIEAPIPGRNLVGIELPNRSPEFVPLKKMMESEVMKNNHSKLAVALGLDVSGKPIITDLGKMPHVLIAGQTGSGKSVCINTFLSTLLFRSSPSEVKLILVDPKRVELTGYNQIPHLLSPVIIELDKVISSLRWILSEMNRR